MRVLVVEDEPRLAEAVRRALSAHGVGADVAADGTAGLAAALAGDHDVVVLDLMLPGLSGQEVCRALRAQGRRTPVLVLTAREGDDAEVAALDAGADDYLRKPFSTVVLVARVFALARRGTGSARSAELRVGDLVLHEGRRQVVRGGEVVELTPREFALLHELVRKQGVTLSKLDLLDLVWGEQGWGRDPNLVEVYIGYLRRKVDAGDVEPLIHTVRGQGYRVSAEEHGAR